MAINAVARNENLGTLDYILPRNPVTHKREFHLVPECVEFAIGKWLYPSMIRSEGGQYDEDNYQQVVEEVGNKIAKISDRKQPYQFTVIDSDEVNAWCLPAGKIGIYRGLIDKLNEEQSSFGIGNFTLKEKIAAVMSHEVVHSCARHTARSFEFGVVLLAILTALQRAVESLIDSREKVNDDNAPRQEEERARERKAISEIFEKAKKLIISLCASHKSRCHELEADRYGMVYLQRAGYDPRAALWLQKFFAEDHHDELPGVFHLFDSHPTSEVRFEENCKTLEQLENGELQ